MNDLEQNFQQLIERLKETHGNNTQKVLKDLSVEEVDPEFRGCFEFWKSLSGPSRALMLDNARGKRLNKRYARDPNSMRLGFRRI